MTSTSFRRLVFLSLVASALGLIGGGAAIALVRLIGFLTNLALFHRLGWEIPSFEALRPSWWLIPTAVGGALIVSVMARWAPAIRGHGMPEAMEAVLVRQSRIAPRTALAKPVSAAIAIGTGGPFGAEGPIIVTGGALGSLIGQILPVSPSERKILLASGAAAGMAATFGAPVAAVILAIEILLFEFSTRAFVPLVVATSIAAGVHSAYFGTGPLFRVPVHSFEGLGELPLFVLLGLGCGLLAVVAARGLFLFEGGFRRLPVPQFWHAPLGAVGFALVGLVVPRALGVGYDAIGDVLHGRLALAALALLLGAKLLAWWIAIASGTSGGTLAPLLLIGGAGGGAIGALLTAAIPGVEVSAGAFALVGMAATFGAATRATFTSIVFMFELTRDYHVILPLMLATVVADLVSTRLLPETVLTQRLARRGVRVHGDYEADPLRTRLVRELMTREPVTIPASASVAEARRAFEAAGHSAYPIVETERVVGMLARGDLLRASGGDDHRMVSEIASRDVVTVGPEDSALWALQQIVEESVEHLPVLDGDRLIGICTRTDLLRARRSQWEHERREKGWRPPGVRRRVRG